MKLMKFALRLSPHIRYQCQMQNRFSTSLMAYTKLPEEILNDRSFIIKNPDSMPERYILKPVNMGNKISPEDLAQKLDVQVDEIKKTIENLIATKQNRDEKNSLVTNGTLYTRSQVLPLVQLYGGTIVDQQAQYNSRPPIVSIMGHVDHGKTTLLDSLRSSQIAKGEYGGITQKIGAFHVLTKDNQRITFIDTPGHEAFANMRVRGAQFTDIIILVVSALDGVQPQTQEVISIAYNFRIPLIIAINKIDVQGAMIQEVENQLMIEGKLGLEGYEDGNIPVVHISAKTGQNLDLLLELVQFQGEIMELKALAEGFILEARQTGDLEGRGSTALILNGTLKQGDFIIIGDNYSKVKVIKDDLNLILPKAYPSYAIEILGLSRTPQPGDYFFCVENETMARIITNKRKQMTEQKKINDENLIDGKAGRIKIVDRKEKRLIYGDENLLRAKLDQQRELINEKINQLKLETKNDIFQFEDQQSEEEYNKQSIIKLQALAKLEKSLIEQQQYIQEMIGLDNQGQQNTALNIIVKGPDFGTVESLSLLINRVINEQNSDDVQINLISTGVGKLSIKDIKEAKAYDAQILAMNVEISTEVIKLARELGIIIRQHQIIYQLIDDVKQVIKDLCNQEAQSDQNYRVTGSGVIQQIYDLKLKKGSRKVFGAKIKSGTINKKQKFRILRSGEVIYKNLEVANLKHFKDEVNLVEEGKDCGVTFTQDIDLLQGDILESYVVKSK